MKERLGAVTELGGPISERGSRLSGNSSVRNEQKVQAEDHSNVVTVAQGTININHLPVPKNGEDQPSVEIHFFRLGRAVGSGVAVLPKGKSRGDANFEELLSALRDTGADAADIVRFQGLKQIIDNPAAPEGDVQKAIKDYGAAIWDIVLGVRTRASVNEHRWFSVGRLLYGVAIQRLVSDEPGKECRAECAALSGFAHSLNMPPNLRDEIVDFASIASDDPSETLAKANEIAQTCLIYL